MLSESSFKHRNLPDQLADHIVVLMAKGELRPGQRIYETDLCTMLHVSRIPVREALRILQTQGVVRTEPNRGPFVCEFGSEETTELLKVRISVERIALRRLVRKAKVDHSILDAFPQDIENMRRAAQIGDKLASCQADLAFHNRIVELSGSPVLLPIWQSLSRGILVYIMQEKQEYYDYGWSIDDHMDLLDGMRAGKSGALDTLIERHIMGTSGPPARFAHKTAASAPPA
jgi:DNA-binding GntR family transcriptional regulator